ncbi:MAG: hypothetical protein COB83_04315 [Gammaproteobacteria bacterium]|nr:MAG: hypothetical protein COB83_04315 [Gammaproteobacteria bacterium]
MKQLVLFSIIFALLTACSSKPTIKLDYNPDTNFQLFSSYQYNQQKDASFDANPIMIHRIQTAIDSNLAANNFTKYDFVDKNSADLTIKVSFSQQEKQNNSSFSIGLGKSTIGGHSGSSIGLSTNVPINSTADVITTIIIDISDKNQAIWHGSDVYEAAEDSTMQQTNQAVNATVNRLLAHFPPQAITSDKL